MAKISALGHAGVAFETAFGTAVVPVMFVPYNSIKVEDDIKKVTDDGHRGVLAKDFGVYNVTRSGTVEVEAMAYPDILGFFLKAIFGQDTVTGAAAPYSHKFQMSNALCPTVTVSDYNAITERQYAGGVVSEVSLKFDSEKEISMSAKMISKASVISAQSTPAFPNMKPFLGFQAALTLNGVNNVNMVGGEVSLKREAKLIYGANNTQDPSKYVTARMEVDGKLTFDVEDESEFLLYLNGTQPTLKLDFVQDANASLTISFGKIDITKANVDRSQEFVRVDMTFKAVYNATPDAGLATFTLKNAVASY